MRPLVEVVVPVHNEQLALVTSIRRLHAHVTTALPELEVLITITDNASTDQTSALARQLSEELEGVSLLRIEQQGRGRALRAAWSTSEAEVVAYMDVDLSTDLAALAPLLAPLLRGDADLAIGSRLAPGAQVERCLKRELISRVYNRLLRLLLGMRCSDAQCGFKATRREALALLLDRIESQSWFFDTELLHLAEREGLEIFELPVRWVEDRNSSVRLVTTAIENLRGIARLRRDAGNEIHRDGGVPSRRGARVGTTPG